MIKEYHKSFFRHLVQRKVWFIFVLFGIAMHMLGLILQPFLFGYIIVDISNGQFQAVAFLAVLLLLAGFMSDFADLVMSAGNEVLGQSLEMTTRTEFFNSVTTKSMGFHEEAKVGTLMAMASNDIRLMSRTVSPGLRVIGEPIVATIGVLILTFYLQPIIGFFLLLSFPIFFLFTYWYHNRSKPISVKQQDQFRVMNSNLQEKIINNKLIKGFAQEDEEEQDFSEVNSKLASIKVLRGKIVGFFTPGLALTIITGFIFILSVYFTYFGLSMEKLIAINSMMLYLRGPILGTFNAFQTYMLGMAGAEQLYKTIYEDEFGEELNQGQKSPITGKIEFKNVSFEYIKEKPVLHNISFSIQPGETVAILGPTGSGKSTLLKLLTRFHNPIEGQILIDDMPINDYNLENLRSQIGVVEQDIFLFSTSIKDNIGYSKDKLDSDEVVRCAKLAKAHDFITELPDKYDTIIGERGLTLSGGQRQRIGIARAFYSNPKILILDDSTSALDVETEREVAIAIDNIQRNRTTLIITHRLATIRRADKILLLDSLGHIEASGTHQELLNTSVLYRNLFMVRKSENLKA